MSFFYREGADKGYDSGLKGATVGFTAGGIILALVIFWTAFGPIYNVWQQGLAGQAELRRAEQNRQIKVQEAQAVKDSASLYAEAEILRAGGVAKANEIIANGLGGPEGYLRYLYIHMLEESHDKQIIYIPTEAGLPILEAGQR